MHCAIISLFPDMFDALDSGIPGRALQQGILSLSHYNPRNFTEDKHGRIDDRPYGGGPGMVMQAPPLLAAIAAAKDAAPANTPVIYLSPQAAPLKQAKIQTLCALEHLILVCGRYEGIDQRVIEQAVDEQISIGDYVLSGGELAAMALIDACTRLLPGALGHEDSAEQDSFTEGLLDYPHYTRPENFSGLSVPNVLLSGNHKTIARWRQKQALGQTWLQRPDLLAEKRLSATEQALLEEFINEKR